MVKDLLWRKWLRLLDKGVVEMDDLVKYLEQQLNNKEECLNAIASALDKGLEVYRKHGIWYVLDEPIYRGLIIWYRSQ
jgi:hypothetical protein